MQSPEWLEDRAPAVKTQDDRILSLEKDYESSKFQQKVVENTSKSDYICRRLNRVKNDIYDPRLLPGYGNNFALFQEYCRLWDKKAHSTYWCKQYIEFLLLHPERFWYALYAYAKGSSKTVKRKGNTKPYLGAELITVINAVGVDEFFGREMLFVDGDEFYPHSTLVTYFVRYVNAYAGSWQGKKGFESITEQPNEILMNFGITLNSRPRPLNFATCPKCATKFNVSTGEVIEDEDVPEGTFNTKDEYIFRQVEEAKIKKEQEIQRKQEEYRRINMQKNIERAGKAAKNFGLELSFDLDVDEVNTIADTLIKANEIQNKPRNVASLKIDRKTLIWYLEEFRPQIDF